MRHYFRRAILAVVVLASSMTFARAAEVRCLEYVPEVPEPIAHKYWPSGKRPVTGVSCYEFLISGEITKGDYGKVATLYRANHPFISQVRLNSPGGDVEEAIKIGRILRRYLITAWAPITYKGGQSLWKVCRGQSCLCASACALIWFGAIGRHGTVGLHRPHTDDQRFKSLSPVEASAVYRNRLSGVSSYMEEMEAPKRMIETMVATGSAEIEWVNGETDGLERPPSIAEWVDASCGALTVRDNETFLTLLGKKASGQLTAEQDLLLNVLNEREQEKTACAAFVLSSNRDKLSAP
jgi:hypothetical protein